MAKPSSFVREYTSVKAMDRDVRKWTRKGWTVADSKTIETTTQSKGCGCLMGIFGGGRSRAQHTYRYIVRYERAAS